MYTKGCTQVQPKIPHRLFTWTCNNPPLRIIWNNQISKQYSHDYSSSFHCQLIQKKKISIFKGFVPSFHSQWNQNECQRFSFLLNQTNYLYFDQFWVLCVKGTCQSTQGSTSEQGTSAWWTVWKFVSCGKISNFLGQILIWERTTKTSLCNKFQIKLFVSSKRKFGEIL